MGDNVRETNERILALAALCRISADGVSVQKYRGWGERSDRKGWRTATLMLAAHPSVDRFGHKHDGSGKDEAEAIVSLVKHLTYDIQQKASDEANNAKSHAREAEALRAKAIRADSLSAEELKRSDEMIAALKAWQDGQGAEQGPGQEPGQEPDSFASLGAQVFNGSARG
jgi:hypothetical protein